ncbi:MAG TPA: alcohol dehydrogenase catalytic domain-containing protein [Candidatus Binataceae bacterium]|nr:alcohol dehydrogenase catalytic domain-containing protein [Candidatus Binataceae bacterium]
MRALLLDQELAVRRDYPDPAAKPGESLVRVELAGICGTDLELARGYMTYRGVPGHEFVGRVIESGRPGLAGQRVVGEINAACGLETCQWCRQGLGRHCPTRTVLGILGRDGTFADYLILPDDNLLPVPDSVSNERAVFCEPLAAAYEIFEQTRLAPSDSIAILGDGRLGALLALALRAEGLKPIVGGHHRDKLDRAASLGVKVSLESELKPGFDVVIDATGRATGLARAIELVRPRGRLILKSTAAATAALNLAPLVVNEITVIGSRCGRLRPALDALADGRVDPAPLISAAYPLEDGVAAIKAAGNGSNFKVMLRAA